MVSTVSIQNEDSSYEPVIFIQYNTEEPERVSEFETSYEEGFYICNFNFGKNNYILNSTNTNFNNNYLIEFNLSDETDCGDGICNINIDTSDISTEPLNYYISIGDCYKKINKQDLNIFNYKMPLLYGIMKYHHVKLIIEFDNNQLLLEEFDNNEIIFNIDYIKYSEPFKEYLFSNTLYCITPNNKIIISNGFGYFYNSLCDII
jgi:archaellum component FlaF (FlaF/FlaG flagellin family)